MRLVIPRVGLGRGRRRLHLAAMAPILGAAAMVILATMGAGCSGGGQERAVRGVRHRGGPGEGLSPEDRKVVARTALTIMARLAAVRAQVRADQLTVAAQELERARGLTQLIAASAPTFDLRERVQIVRTHLAFQDGAAVVHELVPIERALHELSWLLPIQEAQEHLRRARDALARGDKEAANRNLKAVAEAIVYQEIDLPLQEVNEDILAAQQALQLRRLDEVDGRLGRAESSLDVLTVWASGEQAPARAGATAAPTE